MNVIKRAVVSGVLVAGMGLPMIAAAQSGYGAPRPGQYASDYYGRGYRDNGYGYRDNGYVYRDNGYRNDGYYGGSYRDNTGYYYNRGNGIGPGKGAVIGGLAGVVLGGLLGGGQGALIGGAAGAGVGAVAGAANQNSRRSNYTNYGYRGY